MRQSAWPAGSRRPSALSSRPCTAKVHGLSVVETNKRTKLSLGELADLGIAQRLVERALAWLVVGEQHLLPYPGIAVEHGRHERAADAGSLVIRRDQHVL